MASLVASSPTSLGFLQGTSLHRPEEIDDSIESMVVRKYTVCPPTPTIRDYFELTSAGQLSVLEKLQSVYQAIEKKAPAAGYTVRFVGSNAGTNPMEVNFEACGVRGAGTKMAMPVKPTCVFCAKVGQNEQLTGFEQPSTSQARVIQTLQGNALVIATTHREHWFEHTASEQQDMLDACRRVREVLRKGPHFNSEWVIHTGTEGHQKIPHTHIHTLVGTSLPLGYLH